MSPEDTSKKSDGEKDKKELVLPNKGYDEASKRLGGDPTTVAPAPYLKEDKETNKEDTKNDNKQDSKKDSKADSKATKED